MWGGGKIKYYRRRWLAIFPTYILMTIIYLILGQGYSLVKVGNERIPFTVVALLLNLFGINGFSPKYINIVPGGWYIGIIVIYYIIAPFIYKFIKSTSQSIKFCFVSLGIRVGMHVISLLLLNGNEIMLSWSDMFIFNQLIFIAIGQSLYFIIIKKDLKITIMDQIFIIVTIVYITLQVDSLMLWSLFIIVIICMVAYIDNSILVNKYALCFGKYSFEIYLLHNAVIYVFLKYMPATKIYSLFNLGAIFIGVLSITFFISIGLNRTMGIVKKKGALGQTP